MAPTLWIALGGAIGSVARYWLGLAMVPISRSLPWGTISINITGSFLIAFFGALTATQARFPLSDNLRLFFMIGICGGFTTFSSFSLQTLELLREGSHMRAFLNVGLSVILCLGATAVGYYAAERMNGGKATISEFNISDEG